MKKKINKKKNNLFSKLSKKSLKAILSLAMVLTSVIGVNPNNVFNVAADSQDYDAGSVGQLSAVKFTQVTTGQLGAIALDQSGAVWSWGYNINGRLGLGLTSGQQNYAGGMRRLPYFVDNGIDVVQVQSGYETNYALDSDGYVYTWGRGNEGQMGDGNTNNNNPTPLRVPGLPKIKEIVAGKGGQQHHILALDVNGKIWGWGYNPSNRIGLVNSGPAYHSTPSEVNVPNSVKFVRIETGDSHNIALDEDGGVWTWGHNSGGSLGNGSNTGNVDKPTKINIPSGVKAIDISASFDSSLVLDENHTVWQFGRVYGRTGGTGHAVSVNTPEAVQIKASEINEMGYTPIPQKIFAGESVSYFVDQHGRSWSWGSGRYNGFGREGGFITSQLQMESQAVQLPKVFGDGDTQNYDHNPKTPADGAQKNRGGSYGGYGINQLHPTIYDDKYKDKPEDDIWKDLALKPLPKVRQIISSRSSYTMLDEDGNIMKWGYDGSGAVAWGWDYDPKYDQNGSLKTGLYDRYTYEVMFMRGAPQIAPIKLEISDTLEKIYKKEDNSQTDKVEITAEIPASYHSDSLNITIKPELQYMKYVVIPYDPTNTDFSQQDISKEVFDALYDSGKYEVGTLIDSVIESTDKKQIIKKELEISDNSRVIVMIGDKAYGRQLHTIAKHTADNFYTPTELMHEGVGVVDTVEEQLYDGTTDNVVKTNTDHDSTQYGIPLDVNGNVIASPKFGYDTVDISKYAVLPNNEDIYWNFKSGQVSPVSFNLDDVKFKLNEKFTHKFLYERNPENWITLSYDSEVLSTGDPVTGFVMPNDNPETVKKFIEIKRTPPTIEPYQLIGYRFNGGAVTDLDDGNFVHTPLASANITFVYDVAEISGNKGVTDSDGDGVASPGETLHYTITAQNESDFKAKGISIKDTLTDVLPYIDDATSVVVTIDNGGVISTHSLDDLINGITVDIDALGVATATFSVDIIKTLDVTTVTKIKNISFVDDKKPEVEIPTGKSNVVLNKEVKDASGDNFASPGETLQYIITVLNDGTAKANAVIVKDTLSEVLPYVKDTSAVNVIVNNNGVETTHSVQDLIDGIGVDVLAGKNVTITFEVVVKDDLDVKNITKIANKATAGDEEIEIEIPTGKPEVKSNKTVADENNDGFASPGEKLTYNLIAENLGNVEAKNIVIKDTLDHVLPYIDQSNVSVILNNGGVVSVHTIDEVKNGLTVNIEAGAKVSVTFTVTVKNDLDVTTVTTIANKATIGDDEPEIEIPTGKPEVKSNKEVKDASGDNFASPGETLNYVITAENKGAVKAENVTIQDKLDNVLPHVEDTSAVVVTLNNNGAVSTHSVQDLIDGINIDIEAGAKVSISFAVVVKADLDVTSVTKISNKATVGEDEPEIEIPTGDTDVLSAKEVNDASGDNFASPGETLNYVITAENKGAVKAENVTIQDKLENVLPHVEDTSAVVVTLNNNGTISTHSVQDLIDGISVDIEAGAKVSVSFAVVVKADLDVTVVTKISNKATVGETTPEIEIPTGKPEVKSNKEVKDASGDNFASPGETLNYVITAENKGTVKAENVMIQDKLDNVLPHVEDTSSVVVTLNNNGAVSTHSVQDLIDGISVDIEAGAKVSVSFSVVVKADLDVTSVTTISNKATVGEDEPEIEIPTGKPEVKSNKEVEDTDGDNFASPGETLSYVITAENKGAVKAENVTIQDKLDNVLPHVEDTSAVVVTLNNNGSVSTHSVQDLIDGISVDIESGAKVSVSFAVVVKADLDVATVTKISNKATVGETTPEIEIPTGKPSVESNKEVNDASGDNFASPGETLEYVINVENSGAVDAKDVLIQDKLDNVLPHVKDTSLVVVKVKTSKLEFNKSINDLIDGFTIDVEAGTKATVTFEVVVKDDLDVTSVTTISNKATVGETTPEIEIPTGKPEVKSNKEVNDASGDNFASPGETLNYVITAENKGAVKAENVTIQDKLDNVLPHVEDTSSVVVTLNNNGAVSTHSVQDLIDGISVDIEAGAKVSVSFAVVVKADLDVTTVTTISNKATVGEDEPEIEIPTGKPEVKSNKEVNDASGDNFASPGETLNYVITAENKGTVKAENVTIQDKLDNVLPHVEDTSSVVVTLNNNGTVSTHSVQDLIDGISVDIEAGAKVSVSFAVVVKADLDVTTVTTISNKATVGDDEPEIEIPTGKPEVKSNKEVNDASGDNFASPGETLNYVITAENKGAVKAENVTIQDKLDNVLPHVEDTSSVVVTLNNNGAVSTHSVQDLIDGISVDIEAGAKVSVSFAVVVKADLDVATVTTISNKATVGETTPEIEIPTGDTDLLTAKEVKDENNDNFASPGETLSYEITAKNTGSVKAENVMIQDKLDNVLPHVEDTSAVVVTLNNNGTISTHSVQDLIDGISVDIEAGAKVSVSFAVVVKADLDVTSVTTISNKATVGDTTPEIEIPTGKPEVKSNKEVTDGNLDGYAQPGEVLTYEITAENKGAVKAENVLIQDTLAGVIPYVEDTSLISVVLNNNGTIAVYSIQDLINGINIDIESGHKVTVSFAVTVKANLDLESVKAIANKATVGEDEPEIEIPTGNFKIVSDKKVFDGNNDNYAYPGESLTYVISAENQGNLVANNIVIKDDLSQVIPYVEETSGIDVVLDNDGTITHHTIQDLNNGISVNIEPNTKVSVSFTVKVISNLDTTTVTKIWNKAVVGDTTPEIEIPTGSATVNSSKKVVDADGDGIASPNEKLTYTINIQNGSDILATNILVQDKLENVLPHVEDTSAVVVTLDNNGTISTHSVQDLVDGIYIDIDAKKIATVTFTVTVKADLDTAVVTKIANKAVVGKTTPEIEIPTGKVKIVSDKTVKDANNDGFATPGELLTYQITAQNTGNADAFSQLIKDSLTDVLPYVEDTSAVVVTLDNNGTISTHSVQDLIDGISVDIEAGAKVSVSFAVVVKADLDVTTVTTISNKATVGDTTPEIEIPTGKPEVKSNKEVNDASGDNFASPGETLNYVITAENKGAVKAENVTIQDKLDNVLPHVEDTSAVVVTLNNNGTISTHSVQDLIDGISVDIEAGAKVSVSFAVVVKADLDVTTITTISNKATVGDDEPEIEIPTGKPEVKSNKEVKDASGDNFASPGETLNYVITAENKGAVKAENVTIQDKLDNVLPHVEDTSAVVVTLNNNGAVSTHSVQDLIDGISVDIEAGAKVSVSFAVVVKADLDVTTVTKISNKATVGETTPEIEIPTGDTDLLTAKEVKDENNDNFASPGETLSYKITAKNTGSVKAENVMIQDKLDNVLPHVEDTSAVVVTLNNNGTISTHSVQDLIDGISVDIEAGAKVSVSFAVVVKADLDVTTVTTISNKATVGETTPEIEIPTGKPEVKSNKEVNDASGDNFASPGETLNYVITAENKGAVKAENVTIQDKLDNVLPHVEDTSAVTVSVNNNGIITTHSVQDLIDGISVDIEAGAKVSVSFAVVVKADLDVTTVTTISNKATVGETTPEIEIPTGKPEVKSNKEVNDASGDNFASPGETLNYVITAENKGAVKADNVTIQDKLDNVLPHVEDTSAVVVTLNNNGTISTHSVQDLIDGISVDIEAGAKVSVSFAVVVKADLDVTTVTTISNKATVGETTPEIEIPTGKPEVKSNKEVNDASGDNFASPGETLNYVITAENKGAVKAENVTIQDKLDNVLPHVEDTSSVVVTLNNNGAVSTHSVQDLINGISVDIEPSTKVVVNFEVVVKADLDVTTVTSISNKATVGETTPEIEIPTGKPEVKSNKEVKDASGDNFASPGETLNYVITAENKGAVKAENVTIQDKLDNVLPHVEDTSSVVVTLNNNGAVSTHSVQDLIDGISVDIEAGAKVSVSFAVVVKADLDVTTVTTISNKATVGDTTPEIEIPTGDTDLLTAKEVKDENNDNFASPGETLSYEITAKNIGSVKAENVVIQDKLDNVLPHVEDTSAVVVTLDNNGAVSTHSVQDLIDGISVDIEAGAKVSVSFAVVVKADLDVTSVTTISNKATVGKTTPEIEIPTGKPEVKSNKEVNDASGDNFASPGETLNYVITAENKGAVKAENVTIQDKLDNVLPHVEDTSAVVVTLNNNGTISTHSVQDLIDGISVDIEAGAKVSVSFAVVVKADLDVTTITTISNKATVGDDEPEIEIPTGKPEVKSNKEVNDASGDNFASPGETLNYVITAENKGVVKAENVTIQDKLDNVLPHVEDTSSINVIVNNDGIQSIYSVQDLIDGISVDIEAGAKVSVSFAVVVKADLDVTSVTTISNKATVGETTPEIEIPTGKPSVESSKEVTDASGDNFASPGETLSYEITAKNTGNVKAENVTIQDKLDNVLPHVENTSAVVVKLNNNGAVSTHSVQDLIDGISVDIEAGAKVSVSFAVVVKADLDVTSVTTISNKATVGDTTPEIEIPTGKPEVKSNKEVNDASGDNFASPGETLNYVITAENKGAVKAENVMIQDKLENVLPHVEDTSSVLVKINNNGVISTYTIQDLIDGINVDIEAGAKAVASFSVVVKADLDVTTVTTISNKATVGDTTPEIEIPTGSTNINASKEVIDANRDGFASPGETLTYIITAKSTSTIANEPTLVKDTLENVLPYVNDPMQNDVTVNIDGVISTYKISDLINGFTIQLDKNSVAVISFNVVVKENLDVSTVEKIANKAVIGEKNPSVEIPVDNYDVKATKNVTDENGDGKVQLGEVLTYEIVAKNEGSVTANDYLIQDTLENVLPYVENPNSNTVIIDYGSSQDVVSVQDLIDGLKLDINGKSTVSIKFSVQVKTDLNLEDVKSIVNKAVVGNDTPSIEIPFAEVDIWADKAVFDQNGDGYVEGGEILDYVITAKNNGTQPVKNFVIKDEMKEVINSVEDITNITAQVEYRGEVKEVNIQDIIHGITVDLNSSEDIQIRFKVKALNNLDNIKQINNIATIGDKEVEASIEVKAKSILPQTGMGNDRIVISSAIVVIGAAMALISRKGKKDENE